MAKPSATHRTLEIDSAVEAEPYWRFNRKKQERWGVCELCQTLKKDFHFINPDPMIVINGKAKKAKDMRQALWSHGIWDATIHCWTCVPKPDWQETKVRQRRSWRLSIGKKDPPL